MDRKALHGAELGPIGEAVTGQVAVEGAARDVGRGVAKLLQHIATLAEISFVAGWGIQGLYYAFRNQILSIDDLPKNTQK